MTPLWSADARNAPECVNCIVLTAESWACRIVSKLKVKPFHSVNSPLVEPVNIRRASGVHYGSFSVEELTQRVYIARKTDHYTIDGTSDLVGGCMHELSAQRG